VSLARIARTCGINANVLSNWVRLHERGKAGGASVSGDVIEMPAAPAFLAVQAELAPQPPSAAQFVTGHCSNYSSTLTVQSR